MLACLLHRCLLLYKVSADTLLLMQVRHLELSSNQLAGTLPESWGDLTTVSHRCTLADHCYCHVVVLQNITQ